MADQRIFFEQGSLETGDSGERGDSTEGVASTKPFADGERAVKSVFNRPLENMRQRTESLRTAGEEDKYLLDSNMAWIISAGNAAGLSPGPLPLPGISAWDKTAGTFITSAPIVVQPINTPGGDKQEIATYSFTDISAQTGSVAFTPMSIDPQTSNVPQKRAYNGANLIKIVWEAVPLADLASASVANYCNVAITGDPLHTLTISIRDDDLTLMSHLATALATIETVAGQLGSMGLGFVFAGVMSTALEIVEVSGGSYGLTYRMKGTFEREIHYIPVATFSDFFAVPNPLADGDTLAIHFEEYTSDAAATADLTGRRESVPSNVTGTYTDATTVLPGDLFITSNAADVYKIPLSIPLCKRIGDDLYWMDGTVVRGAQTVFPLYFGENGTTVDRTNLAAADTDVTGHWLFNDIISVGTARAVTTSNSYAIYATRTTTASVPANLYGMYLETIASQSVGTTVFGISNSVEVNAAASQVIGNYLNIVTTGNITNDVLGSYADITATGTAVQVKGDYLRLIVNGAVEYAMGLDTYLETNAVVGETYGNKTSVRINSDPGSDVGANLSKLYISDTGGETPDMAFAYLGEITTAGAIADTKATKAGGMSVLSVLDGGVFNAFMGVSVEVPGGTASDAVAITKLAGLDSSVTVPSAVTVTFAYGANIHLDCSTVGAIIVAESAGLNVLATDVTFGAQIVAAHAATAALRVAGVGTSPHTLQIEGSFSTSWDPTPVSASTTSITAKNSSATRLTGAPTSRPTIITITDGVEGQRLVIIDETTTGYGVELTQHISGNILISGGDFVILTANDNAIEFIFRDDKWRDISKA